ncbi:hypothetical protein ZWY2020_006433 [Hordeum vulgare]|nr:hypothetical protein ZWY2020_006433 [Hordeum vulgare]
MAPTGKQKPEAQGPAPAPPLLECVLCWKKVENFSHRWVLMSLKDANPWLEEPKGLPEKTSAWSSAKFSDPRAMPILERFSHDISAKRMTGGMIVKELLAQRLAPLQAHSRPLWDYRAGDNELRLRSQDLPT